MDFKDLETLGDLEVNETVKEREKFPCQHCRGTGTWVGGYARRIEGKCHACNGKGYFFTSPEQRLRARQKAAQKRHAKKQEIIQLAEEYCEEHKNLVVYLEDTKGWNGFSASLLASLKQYGQLTEKQEKAAYNGYAKHLERLEKRAQATADLPVVELTRINEMFDTAKNNGLARPRLQVGSIEISLAPMHGRNAGFLYVKRNGEYAGKISGIGKLFLRNAPEGTESELQEIAKDPMGKLTEHGRNTGNCSCCGRELLRKESIERGIGPICAQKYGLA